MYVKSENHIKLIKALLNLQLGWLVARTHACTHTHTNLSDSTGLPVLFAPFGLVYIVHTLKKENYLLLVLLLLLLLQHNEMKTKHNRGCCCFHGYKSNVAASISIDKCIEEISNVHYHIF